MATARDLIKNSLRLIGAIATGEVPSADEAADGLSSLNNMIDSWSNESLIIHQFVNEEFTLTPGQQRYTMGPTGNFVTTRPIKIESATTKIIGTDPYEVPIEIIDFDEWSRISTKQLNSTFAYQLYAEGSFPNEAFNIWPAPSAANKIVLYSRKPLSTFTNLSDEVLLPPGYLRALAYNLAVEIAPEYGKEASATVMNIAMEAKESIKRTNKRSYELDFDSALVPREFFDYQTGE